MKKLILLLMPFFVLTMISSCNQNGSGGKPCTIDTAAVVNSFFSDSTNDEAFTKTLKMSGLEDDWQIPNSVAKEMIDWYTNCPAGDRKESKVHNHRAGVYMRIWIKHLGRVEKLDARYRESDEELYRNRRPDVLGDETAYPVRNYNTVIYRAIKKNGTDSLAFDNDTTYYDIVTIKPPPEDKKK